MPIHVCHSSRRSFLQTVAGTAAGLSLGSACQPNAFAASQDSNVFALLSDTHVPSAPEVTARGVNMTANLKRAIEEVGKATPRPTQLLINGDCAYLKGLPADYANFAECLKPLKEWSIDLHLCMGNHDDRMPLYDAMNEQRPESPAVMSKHVGVIESRYANWFLLDSLHVVNVVTGKIGQQQRDWLSRELDARSEKPAIVMVHHNPQFKAPDEGVRWNGISDTDELFGVLKQHSHVKALLYGHSHHWNHTQRDGIDLVNLPPVAYVFSEEQPNGWVTAEHLPKMLRLTLHTFDATHPNSGQVVEIPL